MKHLRTEYFSKYDDNEIVETQCLVRGNRYQIFELEPLKSLLPLSPQNKAFPPPDRSLGKYGLLRLRYLKEHRPGLYNRLALSGKLYVHLLETEDAANDRLENMMPGMAKEAGATEDLKSRDPMRWVGLMNCCKAQVEEIIFAELIYC